MSRGINPLIVLAEGFTLADRLTTSRRIAFKQSRKEDGYAQKLFVKRIDGQDAVMIFDEDKHSWNCPPAWSPDGHTLYHSHNQIIAINAQTGDTRAVSDFAHGEHASWLLSCSPDDTALAFLDSPPSDPGTGKSAPHRLCTIGTDGVDFRVVLEQPEGYGVWQADVSWQTRQGVACGVIPHEGTGFWKVSLDGGEPVRFGQAPPGAFDFRLSPNGQQIVYSMHADKGLHIMSLADGQSRQISRNGTNASWSPDGGRVAFMYGDYELWTLSVEDGEFQKLAWFGGRNYHPQTRPGRGSYAHTPLWSPDGRLLWFSLTKSRRLRNGRNPEFLQRMKDDIAVGKGHFGAMTTAQREKAYQDTVERQYWGCIHKHGIVDLAEHRVMVGDGYWRNVAWSPSLRVDGPLDLAISS